jgi:hypothetical protein
MILSLSLWERAGVKELATNWPRPAVVVNSNYGPDH